MRLQRSRKIWRVHERHDFEATSQFQAAEREQTEPTKPHRCAEPGFYRRYSAREIRSSRYKKGSRPASAHAQCQEHRQLRALPSRRVPRRRAQKRRERILDNRKHDGVPRNGTLRRIDASAKLGVVFLSAFLAAFL